MVCSLSALLMLAGSSFAAEVQFISSKKPLPAEIVAPVNNTPVLTMPVVPPKPIVEMPPPKPAVIVPVQAQQPMMNPEAEVRSVADALKDYQILLEPPSPQALFGQLDSEKMLEKRMRQQALQRKPPDNVQFPDKPLLSTSDFKGRHLAPQLVYAEPAFVTYHRLYFEDKNAERYGWDAGFIQPIVSTAMFYKDVIFWPYKIATRPCQRFDTNAGYCLPGDPVPYICEAPEISLSGALYEGATVVALFALFP